MNVALVKQKQVPFSNFHSDEIQDGGRRHLGNRKCAITFEPKYTYKYSGRRIIVNLYHQIIKLN